MMVISVIARGVAVGNVCDVRSSNWKAVGDNTTDDTAALQKAIDDCHASHPLGAIVRLSGPATYRITASLALASNLTLSIAANTSIFSAVTPDSPVQQHPRCSLSYWTKYNTAVLCGTNLTNVAIIGDDKNTSVLDGGGWPWYEQAYQNVSHFGSLNGPRLFELVWTRNITLSHLTFQFSAGWTVHPQFCDGILAEHLRILNPRFMGNTDGFDPDSCTDVVLRDSLIDTGDDGISIKSGNSTVEGCSHIQMPSRDIHIYRVKILSRNFCLGSATYGGIFNILMEDCEIGNDEGSSPWAFKYKSHQSYAGALVNHTYRRIKVGNIQPNDYQQPGGGYFISIELRYHPLIPNRTCHVNRDTLEGDCPIMQNVTFEDIWATGAARAGDIDGFQGDLIQGLTFKNVSIPTKKPWNCGYVDVDTLTAVDVKPPLKCSPGPRTGAQAAASGLGGATSSRSHTRAHDCDVTIAGGSLASAAAAVAAGEASNSTRICFLEITDWPGGQASASGISAMDFGLNYLNFPRNIPRSLAELLTDGKMGGPDYNPGECAYLPKCFAPSWAAEWILGRLAALPNVAVFLNTTVVKVDRDDAGRIVELRAIQRTPTAAHPSGWDRPLSQALPDWYSPTPSAYFDKTQLQLVVSPGGVVVEATEYGDVLMLADGVAVGQGVELKAENSTEYDDHCGNPAAFGMFATWGTEPAPPDTTPAGSDEGRPMGQDGYKCLQVRRYWTANHTERAWKPYGSYKVSFGPGDHYNINCDGGSDLLNAQVFLPLAHARATARAGAWVGGMNLTALAMAENRTYAFYHAVKKGMILHYPEINGFWAPRPQESGTSDGMAKMIYLRESRRSMAGVDGFRLCHNAMSAKDTGPGGAGCSTAADPAGRSGNGTGYQFFDTVGIGAPQIKFGYDVHRYPSSWCTYPSYVNDATRIPNSTVPYYIPFRALTVSGAPNMLVAGKSIAASFLASSTTRLHPTEWASGTAAGVAAVMMSALNLSSVQMATNVSILQDQLRSLGVPLSYTF